QTALFSFLNQYRDIGNLELVDLPASLQSQAELRQLNEGVLQLLPDLSDVSGRSLLIDQLVQQLDSSNPSKLNEILTLGNLQSGPSSDPLLSAVSNGSGAYPNLSTPISMSGSQPLTGGSSGFTFDMSASPEVHGLPMSATSLPIDPAAMYAQSSVGGIISYPSHGPPANNPTLTDIASNPAVTAAAMSLADRSLRVSSSPQRIPSLSPAVSTIHDPALSARPIARPRGMTSGPVPPPQVPNAVLPQGGASLYSNLYTPLQLQQAQQAQYAKNMQMHRVHGALPPHVRSYAPPMMPTASVPYGIYQGKQRVPMPNAQMVDPAAHQAQMNALMMYRAMGLQCKAPEDDEDTGKELSLEEWLDAEKLTDNEVAGGASAEAPTSTEALPTPASTPAASTGVEEPEVEDLDHNEDAYQMRHPAVKSSVLVQRSFAKQPDVDGDKVSSDEPVSYMRQRRALLAKSAAVATDEHTHDDDNSKKSTEEADRNELVRVAVQLLARINTLYHRKIEAQQQEQEQQVQQQQQIIDKKAESVDDSDISGSDDADLDELERELNAMNLASEVSAKAPADVDSTDERRPEADNQDIIDRMAKLGLSSSDKGKVCV
ncbi:hypothetical protein H4R99_008053, partial [Coemansia sp. RSA 1722]